MHTLPHTYSHSPVRCSNYLMIKWLVGVKMINYLMVVINRCLKALCPVPVYSKGTYWTDFRGCATHFLISLFPNAVWVWSSTHNRLPFTAPVVCQQKRTHTDDETEHSEHSAERVRHWFILTVSRSWNKSLLRVGILYRKILKKNTNASGSFRACEDNERTSLLATWLQSTSRFFRVVALSTMPSVIDESRLKELGK